MHNGAPRNFLFRFRQFIYINLFYLYGVVEVAGQEVDEGHGWEEGHQVGWLDPSLWEMDRSTDR